MRDYNYGLSVLLNNAMTAEEKVGLLRTDCYNREEGNAPMQLLKLRQNFRYFAGSHPVIERLMGGFDPVTRVFWFTFDRTDYFEYGGRSAIKDFIDSFKKFGGSCVAIRNSPDWWGIFPMPKEQRLSSPDTAQSHNEEMNEPEIDEKIDEPQKPIQMPLIVNQPKVRTVRNIRRKRNNIYIPFTENYQNYEEENDY